MTEGLHRFYGGNDLHFLTFSCYRRRPLFRDPAHCDLFLKILDSGSAALSARGVGICCHAGTRSFVGKRTAAGDVIDRDSSAKGRGCAQYAVFQGEHRGGAPVHGIPVHPDRFWQARFYDFNVFTERKRIEKLRYIHRNPVERGLVSSPEQWHWSSFRWYRCGEAGPVRINDTDIMVMKIRPPAA
jgi:REP-associated tyrosine transposase